MAEFIDALALLLISVGMGILLSALYFVFAAMGKINDARDKLAIPAMAIGFLNFIGGFVISFTWPLPGGYNMLYGDPLLIFGLLLSTGSFMFYLGKDPSMMSILSFLLGIYVILGAYAMVVDHLEKGVNFLPAFVFYLFAGIGALLSPIVLVKPTGASKVLYYIEFIILVVATFAALFIGYNAFLQHLVDFAHYFPA